MQFKSRQTVLGNPSQFNRTPKCSKLPGNQVFTFVGRVASRKPRVNYNSRRASSLEMLTAMARPTSTSPSPQPPISAQPTLSSELLTVDVSTLRQISLRSSVTKAARSSSSARLASRGYGTTRSRSPSLRRSPSATRTRRLALGGACRDRLRGARREAAVAERVVDPRQVHPDHPPGADVGVPDLGVAHLPDRQPDVRAVRRERRVRAARPIRSKFGVRPSATAFASRDGLRPQPSRMHSTTGRMLTSASPEGRALSAAAGVGKPRDGRYAAVDADPQPVDTPMPGADGGHHCHLERVIRASCLPLFNCRADALERSASDLPGW